MRRYISLLFALSLCNCSPPATNERNTSDSLSSNATAVGDHSHDAETESEDFNNEDHGDPGLLIDSADVDPQLRSLVSSLIQMRSGLIDSNRNILVIRSQDDVSPEYELLTNTQKLSEVNEIISFRSDSLFVRELRYYRLMPGVCQVINEFPDGIYVRDLAFKDIIFNDGAGAPIEALEKFRAATEGATGKEILIKIRTTPDEIPFLHVFAAKGSERLDLAMIDTRRCDE